MRLPTGTVLLAFTLLSSCQVQPSKVDSSAGPPPDVGGPCQGCDWIYMGLPDSIDHVDTSKIWTVNNEIKIEGRVYHSDGKTPAAGVILYYWHTNKAGIYPKTKIDYPEAENHGSIRGWIKTNGEGFYQLLTSRPGSYPNLDEPSHIHFVIKEPQIEPPYYIDAMVFDDDPLLTTQKRRALDNRGGSMILRPVKNGSSEIAEKNIILGLNIPHYPDSRKSNEESGLSIGEDSPSFTPFHAFGPDIGSKTCPVCKYGRYHGLLYFVGEQSNWSDIEKWLVFLEDESIARNNLLKVYFVYGNPHLYDRENRNQELAEIGERLGLLNVALTHVPSFQDQSSEVHRNEISPHVKNTFIIYRQRNIVDKYVNLFPTEENFKKISTVLDATTSPYFEFPESWTLK